MPAATEYKPDDKDQRAAANTERNERRTMITEHQKHYDNQIMPKIGDPVDRVLLGTARQAIDRTTSFLVPQMPQLRIADSQTSDDEQWLMDTWQTNGGAALLANIVLNGAKAGRPYARVAPNEDGYPRIINLDPANVVTFWNADDVDDVLWYELHWTEKQAISTGGTGKREINYRQDIINDGDQWVIRTYSERGNKWSMTDEYVWSFPYAPVLSWQHMPAANQFYGDHEYRHAFLATTIDAVATNINRIIRFHASPRTVGFGFKTDAVVKTDVAGLFTIENKTLEWKTLRCKAIWVLVCRC